LPVGLGGKAGEFNKVNRDTLERIVLKGEDIEKVLREEAAKLQAILNETGAACWPPDPPSTGPCQVR
jgi:multiple sugar transport system substrate-binding protein